MPTIKLSPDLPAGDIIVGDAAARKTDWLWLGTVAEAGPKRLLKLDTTAEHVVAILGKRGTGKSYSLGVLLEGLGADQSPSAIATKSTPRGVLMLDILDIFWTTSLALKNEGPAELTRQYARMHAARIQPANVNVDVWVPAGFENASIDLPGTQTMRIAPSDLTAEDWATLFGVDLLTEPRGMLVDELVRKVSSTGWTNVNGVYTPPLPKYTLEDVIECLTSDGDIAAAYADGTIRSIRQRFSAQAANAMFQGVATPLSDLIHAGRATVLMLGRLPDSYKRVLTSILIKQIHRQRREASFAQKRIDLDSAMSQSERDDLIEIIGSSIPRTWVLIDEAQVLAPNETSTMSGELLVKFAKEGRNCGLSLAVATQQPSALDSRLMSQVETMLVHQLSAKGDIDVAIRNMKSPLPTEIRINGTATEFSDLLRRLEQGTAVFSCANSGDELGRSCIVNIRPRITAHGGYEA